jgi:TetR/AcrR family transcriptional regulator, transcriptional repressor for nem operon
MKTKAQSGAETRAKLLNAAMSIIRAQGYAATTVDDICQTAGVTKGSFFHHFKSKDELAIAAAEHFASMADGLFAQASYRNATDPLARLLGYIDFRSHILQGEIPQVTCLLGTMVQETYDSHPAIREACDKYISAHAAQVSNDIKEAKERYAPNASWSAESLGLFTQAVLQGAFILAKAKHSPEIAVDCLGHLRRYLESLFTSTKGAS